MKHCSYCGRNWDSAAAVCPECGTEEFSHVPPPLPACAMPVSQSLQSVVCRCCQRWNPIPVGVVEFNCRFCGTSLLGHAGGNEPASRREIARAAGAWVVAVALGLVFFGFKSIRMQATESRWARELSHLDSEQEAVLSGEEADRARRIADEEAKHRTRLSDPAFLSGDMAFERHEAEWQRRLRHETSFANSPMERNILKMQELGADTAVTAQRALEEVARLASPKGSRVEVSRAGEGFRIQVAFKMSAVSANESGAVSKHVTAAAMRAEVREITARLTRDLFDYCGSRGIEELQLSCNHAQFQRVIPQNATSEERAQLMRNAPVTMACIYRAVVDKAAARSVTDWRAVPLSMVVGLSRVDRDRISTIHFNQQPGTARDAVDPDVPLEF